LTVKNANSGPTPSIGSCDNNLKCSVLDFFPKGFSNSQFDRAFQHEKLIKPLLIMGSRYILRVYLHLSDTGI
jgi:hypothetical protein